MDGDEDPKLTVPKFSSFKTKQAETTSSSKAREKSDGRHRSKSHRDSDKRNHSRGHHRESKRRVASEDTRDGTTATPKLDTNKLSSSSSSLYVIDTKGDHLIRSYGGIDRAHIPRYYRHGAGRVLGTRGRLVIHQDGSRDKFSLRFPGEGLYDVDGLRTKSLRFNRDPVQLRPRRVKAIAEASEDFLPIGPQKKRKRHTPASTSSDEDVEPSYRSIEGKAKATADVDENGDGESDSASSAEAVDSERDNPLRWKSIQLNKRVKEHPGDIDSWIELVDHQDTLLRAGDTIDNRHTRSAAHSFSEIKVSLLESALSNTSASEDRDKVLVLLMREGMKVWPSKVAARKWTDVADEETNNFELWRAHLDFSMTTISTFQYDDIKTMLLTRLRSIIRRTNLQQLEDCGEAVYVLLRATRFIQDAGYKELALAVWQSILEIHFFKPDHVHTREQISESFGTFWESEVPRIGDDDSQGWKYYSTVGDELEAPAPKMADNVEKPSTRDVYKAWSHVESTQAQRAQMPARTMDEGTEDDPFRVVMFSDFEPWLFRLAEAAIDSSGLQVLVDAFLIFCQLPPAFRSSSWIELALTDQFIIGAHARVTTTLGTEDATGEGDKKPPALDVGVLCAAASTDILFSNNKWFRIFSSVLKSNSVDCVWAANTIQQLVLLASFPVLAEYSLGLSYTVEPTTAKKRARRLLKKFSNAPELYHAYAIAEYSCHGMAAAAKVLGPAVESPSVTSHQAFLSSETYLTGCYSYVSA